MRVILEILRAAFLMFWEVLWPLALGFLLSSIVQTVVSHKKMVRVLGDASPRSILLASVFGAASSSCSYAAVALARSLFTKGASFTAAMVFELASTNVVLELGIVLFVLLGWQFMFAEIIGAICMIVLLSILFRFTLSHKLVSSARIQVAKSIQGRMEGHAAMDMSIQQGSIWEKICSREGVTAISHYFFMDVVAVWTDIFLGFLIAGVLEVVIPKSFWQMLFFSHNHTVSFLLGPLIGPLIAMISFVCSVGNIPLAAVLWQNGISFGGVVSFIFADLIILPILDIYRKYYGWKVMAYILGTFFAAMALAGYGVEIFFSLFKIVPVHAKGLILQPSFQWNYTTMLNMLSLAIIFILGIWFFRTGGVGMLSMMDSQPHSHHS
ncbi:MAG: permease [Patescibacteria group bacterium]|nr:permease [Patescibacteria group bacterium]